MDGFPFLRGILFLPYAGFSIPVGSDSDNYAAGHNLGAVIGAHLLPSIGIGIEANADFMSPGPLATESQVDVAISPIFLLPSPRHLFMLGFKVGLFGFTRSMVDANGREVNYSSGGFVWGVTMGGFVPFGPIALGGLAKLTMRDLSRNCEDGVEATLCNQPDLSRPPARDGISPSLTTFSLSAAALF